MIIVWVTYTKLSFLCESAFMPISAFASTYAIVRSSGPCMQFYRIGARHWWI